MSWVQSGFSWVLLAVQVWKCAGGERCVDLETQKEDKKSAPKGRKAEVTSTVQERLHANNAECFVVMPAKDKFSKAKNTRIDGVFCFLEC